MDEIQSTLATISLGRADVALPGEGTMSDLRLSVETDCAQTGSPESVPDAFQFPTHLATRRVNRSGTWHASESAPVAYRLVDGVAVPVDPMIADVENALERAEKQFLQLRGLVEEESQLRDWAPTSSDGDEDRPRAA